MIYRSTDEAEVLALTDPEDPYDLAVDLRWEPADPLAVTLVIHDRREAIEWLFDYDLLCAGLVRSVDPEGGDIQVGPAPHDYDRILVTITDTLGRTAIVKVPRSFVREFCATVAAVKPADVKHLIPSYVHEIHGLEAQA